MSRVSVVVAAYNEERWIGACLSSLLAQTHTDYDVIVVDDGSRDETAAIASAHGIRLLRTAHRGCGAARHAGAAVADGEVLAFLDADEMYAEDFLEELVAPLDDPAVRGTFPGGVRWLNPGEGLAPGWLRIRGARPGRRPRFGAESPFPKALRREDLMRVGGYPRVGYGEDDELGRVLGPARVVHAARFDFTLPTGASEVFGKARWIGRGPRFERERPPLRDLLPPASCRAALDHLLARRPRAALVRLLYDAGLLVGFLESRVLPRLRQRA
jgi:glycosyltransferase involved in cell wall biosynthesis